LEEITEEINQKTNNNDTIIAYHLLFILNDTTAYNKAISEMLRTGWKLRGRLRVARTGLAREFYLIQELVKFKE
jgi:hypothetical protein